jgi:hypothetical protein
MFVTRAHQTDPREHQPCGRVFRPVLFYVLAFSIAWAAWTPLLLHKLDVLRIFKAEAPAGLAILLVSAAIVRVFVHCTHEPLKPDDRSC